jgi:hypothetical protein
MKEFDIKQNPHTEELADIIMAVEANEGYCPCALEKNEDTKCMCKVFRDSKNTDFCHCGRFYKVKNYETIALIGDISEEEYVLNYMNWYERLIQQDFIVLGIPFNLYDIQSGSERHLNLCKSIIAKADAVIILGVDKKLYLPIEELIDWSSMLGKKVLTREDLVK